MLMGIVCVGTDVRLLIRLCIGKTGEEWWVVIVKRVVFGVKSKRRKTLFVSIALYSSHFLFLLPLFHRASSVRNRIRTSNHKSFRDGRRKFEG